MGGEDGHESTCTNHAHLSGGDHHRIAHCDHRCRAEPDVVVRSAGGGRQPLTRRLFTGRRGGFANVTNHVAATGKLLSVRFDTSIRFPGARSVNGGVTAVTLRLDTGDPIAASAMFTPAAKDGTGVKALAVALRNTFQCDGNPTYGDESIRDGIADALQDKPGAAVIVVPNGLWFSFGTGSIAPNACGILTGLLLFTALDGFVDPALVTLASTY
ncbi:hypothetical protein AB0J72_39295 [Dactylosporangium sp. NPDC049742]|uniref:hypothetical protein n=1 Tax=Dactylosporangium sp. NPDC049742 TaxID=3154737 RepID=UPI003437CDAE